jgi:hypothetical protein
LTAFVVSAGGVVNWQSLTGGSINATLDSYAISNGTTLLIDTDSYQCTNHTALFGSLDTVTYSGVGGRLKIDGTSVRVMAYTAGTGVVPAIGTTITQGGVTGYFLGVWASWLVEPTAAGTAMPATGFIKIKGKAGGSFAAGALTGISATSSGADVVGWIEVRGADTATITVPRIGAFEVVGDWFELGTTTGVRGQVLACPTTATVAGVFPGVWVETASGSGVYERFAGCGSMVAVATNPTDARGKIVWQIATGIRIGSDGTNNVGFLPPAGCRVRIPNVIMTCCARTAGSGSGPRVLPNVTLATRQEFVTTSAGDISISNAVMNWYGNFLQAYRSDVVNSAVSDSLILQEVAAAINVSNVIVSPTQAQLNFALNMVSCFGGGTVQNCTFARFSLTVNSYVNNVNYNKGVTFSGVRTLGLLLRANSVTGCWSATQNVDCSWVNCFDIGSRMAHFGAQRPVITNYSYADNFGGVTTGSVPVYALDFSAGCVGVTVDGVTFAGLTDVHPNNGIVTATGCYDITVRNIGTYAAPLNLGSANASGVVFNGAGNNDRIRLQRIYTINTRTGPWAFLNSDNSIVIQDVRGDYADTSVVASLNTLTKGVALLGATAGQVSVYGTHWKDSFTSATVGKLEISCNEATSSTAAQCFVTSGVPQFNSSGQVAMTVVGQQIVWEMPYFARGHTALANLAPTLTGTNTGNLTYEFQCDTGGGYGGTWLTLNAANLTAQGAINPATGVKVKVQATCSIANAGNLLTNIAIPTVTTSVAQGGSPYPLDVLTLTLTGLVSGSDVVVRAAGTSTILASVDSNVASSWPFVYETVQAVDIDVIKPGYVLSTLVRNFNLSSSNSSLPVSQIADRNYS